MGHGYWKLGFQILGNYFGRYQVFIAELLSMQSPALWLVDGGYMLA
jgi:hypothetical protein